ncbi:MAG: 50S ribosomal protein L22 [Candidatus Bathyarchaeota archaeon]|nr:50S ribosomal protein L22 [Candidatus Bathyarchaeota archaeon]
MPKWGYSVMDLDPDTTAKASGRELRVSPKAAREVCTAIKGMKLDQAKEFLELVRQKKKAVPFRRFKKTVPHRKGLQRYASGRYPVGAAGKILQILETAESAAMYKGLDTELMRVVHAAAYPGTKIKRYIPRAMGRSSPRFETLCHVEIVLEQVGGET